MTHLTQNEILEAIESQRIVILPTGAIEANGPQLSPDTDSPRVKRIAVLLAE